MAVKEKVNNEYGKQETEPAETRNVRDKTRDGAGNKKAVDDGGDDTDKKSAEQGHFQTGIADKNGFGFGHRENK